MTSELHNITGNNDYCFPAVLASVVGISTDDAEHLLQQITGSFKPIKGVLFADGMKAFIKLRYEVTILDFTNWTLYSFIGANIDKPGIYLISVGGHVILIEIMSDKTAHVLDNHTKKPINAANSARLMQRIVQVCKIVKKDPPVWILDRVIAEERGRIIYIYRESVFRNITDNIKILIGKLEVDRTNTLTSIIEALSRINIV